jgi:hypothetical protein
MRAAPRRAFVKAGLVLFEMTRALHRRLFIADFSWRTCGHRRDEDHNIRLSNVGVKTLKTTVPRFRLVCSRTGCAVCDSKDSLFCFSVASLRFPPDFSLTNQRGDSISVPGVNLEAKG